jgi:hypothetical protein
MAPDPPIRLISATRMGRGAYLIRCFKLSKIMSTAKNVPAPANPSQNDSLVRLVHWIFGQPVLDPHLEYMLTQPRRKKLIGVK